MQSLKKGTYLLMLMIIAPLMCLEFIDSAIALLAELTIERLAGLAGGLCLYTLSEKGNVCEGKQDAGNYIASRYF